MASTIVQDLFTNIDSSLLGYALGGAASVAAAARPVFNVMVSLFVVLWGLAIWRGLVKEPLADGVVRILKIVLIGTFALNAGVYGPRIATAIYKTPEQLAMTVAPSASSSGSTSALDAALDKGVAVGTKFSDATSLLKPMDGLMLMLQAVIVWVATAILVGYAAALILLAKISMTVVLTLGPLFIGLLLFDATKQFFTGWLNQALNGLFQYVIAVLIVSIGIGFFATAADSTVSKIGSATPTFLFVLQLIIVGVAVFVALMQAGAIASALAGGVQLATMGAVGALTNKAAAFAAAPFTAMKALRSFNQNRIASDYHRQQMGLKPTMTTRMINRAVRGHNEIQKK